MPVISGSHLYTHTLATYVTKNPQTTPVTCSQMWPSTCDQHFLSCPRDTFHAAEGLSDVWSSRCEMWRASSVRRGFNGGKRLHIWTEWLIHQSGVGVQCWHGSAPVLLPLRLFRNYSSNIQRYRSMSKALQHFRYRAHVSGQSDKSQSQDFQGSLTLLPLQSLI